jgi:hypothetical protein
MKCGPGFDRLRPDLTSSFIYRVSNDAPEIVRVLDGRRDLDEIFAESP